MEGGGDGPGPVAGPPARRGRMAGVAQHEIDPDRLPYAPEGLEAKPEVGAERLWTLTVCIDLEPAFRRKKAERALNAIAKAAINRP